MARKMKQVRTLIGVGALLVGLHGGAAAGPDGSLIVTVTPDRVQLWPSQTVHLTILVAYRNATADRLRSQVPPWPYEGGGARIFVRGTDGTHYIATGQEGTGNFAGPYTSADYSVLLGPNSTHEVACGLGTVCRSNAEGFVEFDEATDRPAFRGNLMPGDYDIWVQHHDGAAVAQPGERLPAEGLYASPPVRIRVLPEGTPLAAAPRLQKKGGKAHPVLAMGSQPLVSTRALEPWGVKARVTRDAVLLSRGTLSAALKLAREPVDVATRRTTATPAANSPAPYVPLRHAAERLRFRVAYEPRTKVYRLESLGKA
jgi:hypothetical protein